MSEAYEALGQLGGSVGKALPAVMDGLPDGICNAINRIHISLMPSERRSYSSPSHSLYSSHCTPQYSGWGEKEVGLFFSILQS